MERTVRADEHYELWVEETGRPEGSPLLLVMGANASGATWPDELVARLGARHRVVRYDHRDTGRSTRAFAEHPYALRDLAADAVAVLDALGLDRAHAVGMSMGGTLVQLLLLDHPGRLLSATVLATSALGAGLADPSGAGDVDLPGPDPRLLELWQHLADPRDPDEEILWRVEHWRILNGDALPFDPEEFRRLEERVVAHSGTADNPAAHALADQSGLDRAGELAGVTVPVLVVEAPEDPVNPPPHAQHLAASIGSARLVTVPGLGHALPHSVLGPLADVVLEHTAAVDGGRTG
ncbi:esterase [Kocuria rosea subsp. polaris]|uniref:Esterase n=1 Tax=Kocuria rosea subsp. polaris TaxID=136273 RepID=A0A0W8I9E0_KOCRO|nr:alpha/beta hydrolase [Kocuria polaris]KUG56518.1 esterase [Kocuria polaris]